MKFLNFINEKKVEMTGDQHKDYFLSLLNKWDTDFSKMTKAYNALKVPDIRDFYQEPKNEWARTLKKDFMNHPDMKKFLMMRKAFGTFIGNFDSWIYTKIIDPKKSKQENYFQSEVRSTAWQVIINAGALTILFPDEYDQVSGKHIPAPWSLDSTHKGNSRKQNIIRYQGKWRKFKEAYVELIKYQADEINKAPKDEQIQKLGVNIVIKNKTKEYDKYVKIFLDSLKDVTSAIKKNGFDKVLRDFYIELNFNVASEPILYSRYGDMVGGAYDSSKDKLFIFPLGINRKLSDSTLIHELAHRYWFRYIPEKAKRAWKEKFESQSITVDLQYIQKFFELFFDEKWGFPSRKEIQQKIDKTINNPTLKIIFEYLADNTPIYDPPEGVDRYDEYMKFMERRARGQKIPLEWITDYGRTNELESFAEAFKLWVGGVKGKLGPWTRAFFKEIVSTGGVNIKEDREKMNLIEKYLGENVKYKEGQEIPYTKGKYKEVLSMGYKASIIGTGGGYADTHEFGGEKLKDPSKIDIIVDNAERAVKSAKDPKMKGRKFMISIKK
jgi:hypothetical protein